MNKYRKEPYITQRQGKNGLWSFQVFIRTDRATVTQTFSEKAYGSAKVAFDTAVMFRNRCLVDIAENTILKKDNVTVREVFEDYLENAPVSLKTKQYHRKLFNKYFIHKDTKVQELTRADIVEELNKMVEKASDDTIHRVYSIWKNDIIETAISKEYLNRDLTIGIKVPNSLLIRTPKDVTTDRETVDKVEHAILTALQNHYNANVIVSLIETLYYTGLRPAEALVLTRDDINIKKGFISVTKELGSSLDETNVVRRCKTPSSVRNVPIHEKLLPVLRDILDWSKTDNIFAKSDGHYMDSTWLGNCIRYVCKARNIEFNLYRLRHNVATTLVTSNVDSRTTMEILGHKHYDMSLYYATSNDDLKEDAVGLLS